MAQGYNFDIFISYRREGSAYTWATKYFVPLLKDRLLYSTPPEYNVKVFIDSQISTGDAWSLGLINALNTSRCLLPIWSPDYFRSHWCEAELQTMLEREKVLNLRKGNNVSGLIYPVIFKGVRGIPQKYKDIIQFKDLSDYGFEASAFADSPKYLDFSSKVEEVCDDLWKLIQTAPIWQDNWPLITPKALSAAEPETSPDAPFILPGRESHE